MRILVLCHYGIYENTPRSFRAFELIRALINDNYDIDLLEGKYKKLTKNFTIDYIKTEEKNEIKSNKKKFKLLRKIGSSILNFIYGDMVILKYYRSNLKLVKNEVYDVIISIGQPFYPHMISARMNRGKAIKIADCGDPFYVENHMMGKHIELLQKYILKKMDYICIPIEDARSYYKKYVDNEKIKVIPQGVDFNGFEICEYCKHDIPTFAYAGVFYEEIRDPRLFLKYLVGINVNYKFFIFTDTQNAFFLNEVKPILDLDRGRIIVNGIISRNRCINELSKMDFVINFENISSTQAPSKIIDYGIAGRPVLSFSEKTFDSEVFDEFLKGNYTSRLRFDISKYDIKYVVSQFERLFERPLENENK